MFFFVVQDDNSYETNQCTWSDNIIQLTDCSRLPQWWPWNDIWIFPGAVICRRCRAHPKVTFFFDHNRISKCSGTSMDVRHLYIYLCLYVVAPWVPPMVVFTFSQVSTIGAWSDVNCGQTYIHLHSCLYQWQDGCILIVSWLYQWFYHHLVGYTNLASSCCL